MARSRERKPDEFYLGQIRELKKENKALKQKLKQLERREHLLEELNEEDEHEMSQGEILVEEPKLNYLVKCNECGKGHFEEFEIMNRVYGTCNICGHRKKIR